MARPITSVLWINTREACTFYLSVWEVREKKAPFKEIVSRLPTFSVLASV